MALTQPILNSIAAFDATQEHIFSFISIGGDQVLGSQLTIYDNETGAQVYQGNYTSFKFEHPLAAGTLTNGKYYNATISTINNASEFSELSNPVAFYCYTAPVLTITNIPASGTIEQSNYTFQGNYVQAEGELLNGYQYTLYDSNKEQISQSAILYDGLYQYTFSGMANDTSYYVELSGSTINNTPVSSGLLLFTIRYIQPASFAICDLVNNCQNGFIQISSNIVSIDGKSEPDPPKYIDNKEVDLTGEDISIEQDMKTYWSFVNQQAFNITYDKDTLVNDIKVSTNSGWETVYLPINVTQGRKYTMTFDCDVITQYTPLTSEFKGIRYQVLANVPVNDNLDKEIAGGYIHTLKGKRNYSISFIPTTDIVYFAFNFGFVEDYVQVETKIGNFNLSVGSWVQWDEGFNIQNDFTMRIWGRSFGDNEPIVTMKNELDTNNAPNRIEMKFMATDIIDTLPNYIFAANNIVTTENAVNEPITDLGVGGNSYQKVVQASSESVKFESDNGSINNANPKLGAKLDIEGNSYQETTQGYNLLNVSSSFTVTSSQNYRIVSISLKANTTYTVQADEINTDNTSTSPNFLFRFRYNNNDVSFERMSLRTKKVPFTTRNDGVDTVWIYSGTDYDESATTNTTFKNLMIYEGTAEKSYEPYTGGIPSPNPDSPQKIQNVGDNINLLNKDTVDASNNLRGNVLDTGRRLIANKDGTYAYGVFKLGGRELLGKTLGIHADIETTGGNPRISIFAGNSSSLVNSLLKVVLSDSGTRYMTIPSNLNSELDTISAVLYVTTDASVVAGTYVDYTNLKVQVGSEEVVYSAYNCGSLGVTIRNENFGDAELLYSQMKNFSSSNVRKELVDNKNCIVFNNTSFRGGLGFEGLKFKYKENTRYVIRGKFRIYDTTITSGAALYMQAVDLEGNYIGIIAHQAEGSEWIQFSFATNANSTLSSINFSYGVQGLWCLDMDSLEIYEGDTVREVPKSQVQTIIFPLTEGQKLRSLPNGVKDYLAEDGIHKNVGIIILNGSGGANESYFKALDNKFALGVNTEKGLLLKNLKTDNLKISVLSDKFLGVPWNIMKDTIEGWQIALRQDGSYTYLRLLTTGIEDTKALEAFLQNNNAIVEYPLAKEEIIPYTAEQQAAYNQHQNLNLYEGVNNFSFESGLYPISTLTYNIIKASPAPDNPSEVHFIGGIGNQIDFPDTSVSYTDGLHVAAKPNNNYILLPNRIYTLNFDYVVTNSTTDIYYGIGYGTKDNYVGALTINGEENIQYATQNKGSNSITFQTPATFEGVDTPYLWIDFAKTTITATVAVDISNVSLYFGEYTEYQTYGRYNVPFKILGQNLFNYQKLLYFIDNNTTHEVISNGYSINPTVQNSDCYVSIGYTNNLVAGEKYTLSYQTLGNVTSFNLYAVEKGTSEIANEITLTNGVFVAPDNNYDLMLKFTLDSSNLTNNVNIWNIQIAKGEELLDYAAYTENGLNMDFGQPLRGIGNVRDYILLDNVNLINPTTLRAKVKENTTYYFSNNTTNSYLLEFYNAEDNLIDSEDMTKGAFTTPANCTYITSEDFTTANVTSEQLQIEEGNTFSQYFPYISQPSVVRNVGKFIINGEELWNDYNTQVEGYYKVYTTAYKTNSAFNEKNSKCNYFKTIQIGYYGNSKEDNYSSTQFASYITIRNSIASNKTEFINWLKNKYSNGEPVVVYYLLSTPQIYNLSGDYEKVLRNFATQVGINNILIDSQYPGYLRLKYANSYTEQETKANYVLLKCWNENTIPYMIHSNYITVKSPKDKIFIWTRRKNNIFDLKIGNLGEE